jgi:hypothetical protein
MPRPSFTEHPRAVGETYLQHLHSAWSFAAAMIAGGLACFVHGLFPFLCTTTGSSAIRQLHERTVVNRVRTVPAAAEERYRTTRA